MRTTGTLNVSPIRHASLTPGVQAAMLAVDLLLCAVLLGVVVVSWRRRTGPASLPDSAGRLLLIAGAATGIGLAAWGIGNLSP